MLVFGPALLGSTPRCVPQLCLPAEHPSAARRTACLPSCLPAGMLSARLLCWDSQKRLQRSWGQMEYGSTASRPASSPQRCAAAGCSVSTHPPALPCSPLLQCPSVLPNPAAAHLTWHVGPTTASLSVGCLCSGFPTSNPALQQQGAMMALLPARQQASNDSPQHCMQAQVCAFFPPAPPSCSSPQPWWPPPS